MNRSPRRASPCYTPRPDSALAGDQRYPFVSQRRRQQLTEQGLVPVNEQQQAPIRASLAEDGLDGQRRYPSEMLERMKMVTRSSVIGMECGRRMRATATAAGIVYRGRQRPATARGLRIGTGRQAA